MKKLTLIAIALVLISALFAPSRSEAYYLDTPHNESNNILCLHCHTAEWWDYTGSGDIDDTLYNYVCLKCHDENSAMPQKGPAKKLHSSANTTSTNGTWSTECVNCHNTHFQGQLDWADVDGDLLYLAEGNFDFAAASPNFDSTQEPSGATTVGFTNVTGKPGWDNPVTWVSKGGNVNPARAVDMSRGLILVPDKLDPEETFEIIGVNLPDNTLTVKGFMGSAIDGQLFGVIYGQAIRSFVYDPLTGYRRNIKFFNPNAGPDSYGGFVDTSGSLKPVGICQNCHTKTVFWNNSGAPDSIHHKGYNCNRCHKIPTGGKGRGHFDTHFPWDKVTAVTCGTQKCHNSGSNQHVVMDVHGGKCLLCHNNENGGRGTAIIGANNKGDATPATGGDLTAGCRDCHYPPTYSRPAIHENLQANIGTTDNK